MLTTTLRSNAKRILPAPVIAALVLIFFAPMVFSDHIIAHGDAYTYFYPYWHTASSALRAGRIPLWNDMLFMGAPFMANGQIGLFYPPNVMIWLVAPDAPTAFKLSLLLHLIWAGAGMLALLRRAMHINWPAALTGAALFTVGGGLTTHAAQINQLQGMAWLPWLFLLLNRTQQAARKAELASRWALLTGALAMQLLTGHTQTLFIGALGMGTAALWWAWQDRPTLSLDGCAARLMMLPLAGIMALLLTLPQVAPTLELSRLSNRAGGLPINEVVSFSLHPFLFGRALLPNYGVVLHGEFVATLGIGGLALALMGAWWARKDARWQAWGAVTAVGLILSFGKWNQFYWRLGLLPGFNLFRVPARWLALWALGASVLAAYAVHHLTTETAPRPPRLLTLLIGVGVLGLTGITYLAPKAKGLDIPGMQTPRPAELIGWLGAAMLVMIVLWRAQGRRAAGLLVGLALLELLAASRTMAYNRLTAPDAFSTPRAAIRYMQEHNKGAIPPPRYLSISGTIYELSDRADIEAAHADLSDAAMFDLLVAAKLKDVIAPNLGMVWGLSSVDGFGGGVLPLKAYSDFTAQFTGETGSDGRLRERLTALPDAAWLRKMGVRYLITDPDIEVGGAGITLVDTGDVNLYETSWEARAFLTDKLTEGTQITGEAKIVAYAPESVTIIAEGTRAAYLVLTDAYYPGWQATVDGTPADIQRAWGMFRAVQVPAGTHIVQMTYRPTRWPAALVVGALAWLTWLGIYGYKYRQRQPRASRRD